MSCTSTTVGWKDEVVHSNQIIIIDMEFFHIILEAHILEKSQGYM